MPTAIKKKVIVTKKVTSSVKPIISTDKISAKKIGKNLVLTISGSKPITSKINNEKYETIKAKIVLYNKKPTDTLKKQIIKLATPETSKKEAEKEKIEVEKKGYQKLAKKKAKENKETNREILTKESILGELEGLLTGDEDSIKQVEEILKKFKKVEVVAPVSKVGYSSRGEY